ncbi:hypothetical protein ACHAWF_017808 [Thalassiosira exigua]
MLFGIRNNFFGLSTLARDFCSQCWSGLGSVQCSRRIPQVVHLPVPQVGLPPELTEALLEYCDETGIADLMRKLTSTDPLPPAEDGGGAYQFARGDDEEASWIVHRPVVTDEEGGDFHLIYPADERTHESYLRVLAGGGLDVVLTSLGEALGVDSLAAYQVGFEGMSNGARDSERNVFVNELTVPLVLDRDVPPELIPRDDRPGGAYRYRVGTGVVAGGNASNRTRGGMRLAATVHLAAISSHNAAAVSASMTRIFPARNVEWLLAQEARHWRRGGRRGGSLSNGTVGDRGRRAFRAGDEDGEECAKLAKRGLCETDPEGTRGRCPFSCEVYVLDGPVAVGGVDDAVGVCVQNRTGLEECRTFEDDPSIPGDFVAPHLEPGEMFPMLWREDRERVAPYAFQVGLPPELTSALLEYADDTGIADEMRRLTGDAPLRPIEGEDALRFQEFEDGTRWYVQRPPAKWQSNMHWISPADERTHEEYLKVLARGDFDLVLDAVGSYLGLKSLVAYHLTFIGVSHSVRGFVHWDSQRTGASVYNVIVPLILADDGAPELRMTDFHDASEAGLLKYRAGTAALMGDDAMHATEAMRLAATVYVADVHDWNVDDISDQTLTQAFPPKDPRWLLAQAGRHWKNDAGRGGGGRSLSDDFGRGPFSYEDALPDCERLAADGKCTSDIEGVRWKCPLSCDVYLLDGTEEK